MFQFLGIQSIVLLLLLSFFFVFFFFFCFFLFSGDVAPVRNYTPRMHTGGVAVKLHEI